MLAVRLQHRNVAVQRVASRPACCSQLAFSQVAGCCAPATSIGVLRNKSRDLAGGAGAVAGVHGGDITGAAPVLPLPATAQVNRGAEVAVGRGI